MNTPDFPLYPGKREFDQFLTDLPKDEKSLTQEELFELATRAGEIFNKGIPRSDRPYCIYLFYHFLGIDPAHKDNSVIDNFPNLLDYAESSLSDPQIKDYISLLDAEKLYEVCQIRGELKSINIGLIHYYKGTEDRDWDDISSDAEEFIKSEPCLPQRFLEYYYLGMNKYCEMNKSLTPRRFELAKMIWDTSTDEDLLYLAWSRIHDVEEIRFYKKQTLDPKEAKKVYKLEHIEKEVMAEFGDEWRGRTAVGKALQYLTKEGREEKQANRELRNKWHADIKLRCGWSLFGNDPYVKGYVAYLNAFVSGGTDDWGGAEKDLKTALEDGFDPRSVLEQLVSLLDGMKQHQEAATYMQQLIDLYSVEEEDVKEDSDKEYIQSIRTIFRQSEQKPLWANRIWKKQAEENTTKRSSTISALSPQIQKNKRDDVLGRTAAGMTLLDNMIELDQADEVLNNNQSFSDVTINNEIDKLLDLSLEEIDLYQKAGSDKLAPLFAEKVNLGYLVDYNQGLIDQQWGNLAVNLEIALNHFPNTLASIPITKPIVSKLIESGQSEPARLLVDHLLSKRTRKVIGLYAVIEPVLRQFKDDEDWPKIIEVSKKARAYLQEPEHAQATVEMIEAYVHLLSAEKSLNEKDRLLKSAESEHLADLRLAQMREEVDALLSRRKRIINRILICAGGLLIVAVVLAIVFKDSLFNTKEHPTPSTMTQSTNTLQPDVIKSRAGTIQETHQQAPPSPAPAYEQTPPASNATSLSPDRWKIDVEQMFSSSGEPLRPELSRLVAALETNTEEGMPVSRQEFIEMLKRPQAQLIYRDEIIKYATPASLAIQKKEHEDYTKIFMKESYQKAGLEFIRNQSVNLERAEREYGVLQKDIVSLLIWESGLGKFTGTFQEFNVFLGQILFLDQAQKEAVNKMVAEGNPNPLNDAARAQKERTRLEKRKSSAIANLAALLRVCKKQGLDPFDMKGSWGGAIGSVQFMPVNLKYAVDGDSDGNVNLSQWPDAIMSVANYLKILGKYDTTAAGRNRAILRYNPSKEYTAGVMLLADTIWQRHLNGE